MFNKAKILVLSLPLLLACMSGTANAVTLDAPDGGGTGGCAASNYYNWDAGWQSYVVFNAPAIANGQSVHVQGTQTFTNYSGYQVVTAYFDCNDGVLTTGGYEMGDIDWYAI